MKRPIKREGQGDNSASLAAVCCPPFSSFLRWKGGGGQPCLFKRSHQEKQFGGGLALPE